jgi:hypothetical protein
MEIATMMHLRKNDSQSGNMMTVAHVTFNNNTGVVCYSPMLVSTNGIWKGINPLDYSLPLFILQMTIIVVMTRILVVLLKPFRQPRVIAEIMVIYYLFMPNLLVCACGFISLEILFVIYCQRDLSFL